MTASLCVLNASVLFAMAARMSAAHSRRTKAFDAAMPGLADSLRMAVMRAFVEGAASVGEDWRLCRQRRTAAREGRSR